MEFWPSQLPWHETRNGRPSHVIHHAFAVALIFTPRMTTLKMHTMAIILHEKTASNVVCRCRDIINGNITFTCIRFGNKFQIWYERITFYHFRFSPIRIAHRRWHRTHPMDDEFRAKKLMCTHRVSTDRSTSSGRDTIVTIIRIR